MTPELSPDLYTPALALVYTTVYMYPKCWDKGVHHHTQLRRLQKVKERNHKAWSQRVLGTTKS